MSLINQMPDLLSEVDPRDTVPEYIQLGYAFWTVRSMLGRGRYDEAEERIVLSLWRKETAQAGRDAVERRAEFETDAPRIKAHFMQEVNTVLEHLHPDGSCRVKTRSGGVVWTASPEKIARELGVLPAAVRQAQAQLATKKTG